MQPGLVARTPRGRVLTDAGVAPLGLAPPADANAQLDLLAGDGEGTA